MVTICALALLFACNESIAQQKQKMKSSQGSMHKEMPMDMTPYPCTAGYSSHFEMGNPAYARKVLELWKDFDNNTLDAHDYFADTAVMFLSNGMMMRGKDSIYAGAKAARASMSNVTSSVEAWVPLKSIDRNENWVAIWGAETATGLMVKLKKKICRRSGDSIKMVKWCLLKQFSSKVASETQQ